MRLPQKLNSDTHEAERINDIIDYLRSLTPQSTGTTRVTHTKDGVTVEGAQKPKPSGNSGWFFGSAIELPVAPFPSFSKQQVIHIQAAHAIVTAGVVDLANPTGPPVMSRPGLWVATQSVPGQVTGTSPWNLPQFPLPNPANMDDALNFWIYLGEQYC